MVRFTYTQNSHWFKQSGKIIKLLCEKPLNWKIKFQVTTDRRNKYIKKLIFLIL